MVTNVENNSQLDVRESNPAELVDAEKVDLSNVTDVLPADEETLKDVNSLGKGGSDFMKVIDGNKELSDLVKEAFPRTYRLAKKALKRFENAKGNKMTNGEVKKLVNGFINSLTPIVNFVMDKLDKLSDPRTIEKIKFIKDNLNGLFTKLEEKRLVNRIDFTGNVNESVEEFANDELVEEELEEVQKDPVLEKLKDSLSKDIAGDIIKMRKELEGSRSLGKEEKKRIKEEVAGKVDTIVNFVNDNSGKIVKYAVEVRHVIGKLGAVKSLLVNSVHSNEKPMDEKLVEEGNWKSEE